MKTNMTGAKEVHSPLSTSTPLHLHDVSILTNVTQYHKVIGALQYFTLTCLDISYTVNKLSQFIH